MCNRRPHSRLEVEASVAAVHMHHTAAQLHSICRTRARHTVADPKPYRLLPVNTTLKATSSCRYYTDTRGGWTFKHMLALRHGW